jgi:hypothetical protein
MFVPRREKRPLFPTADQPQRPPKDFVAAEDAQWLADNVVPRIDEAAGVGWYLEHGAAADRAALTLCRLRRARAGERGGPEAGDESVRAALSEVSPEALLWIASRAISYMDENGFPEAVEPWFDEEGPITTSGSA